MNKEKEVSIVLGLGFGDEGKGNVTNALATKNSLVVQFNGGHQKGHTVSHNGIEHVFSSFGSGTLKGAATYISEYCTVNPIAFVKEYNILKDKGVNPSVYMNRKVMLTTPYDIIYNLELEEHNDHGSVGVGFGATIERNENHYRLFINDIYHSSILSTKIKGLSDYYDVDDIAMDEWFKAVKKLKSIIESVYNIDSVLCGLPEFDHVIFEGSQGIMLDQEFGFFPHVTRSHTTSKNAFEIIDGSSLKDVSVTTYYVTRAYTTRHGNGPMNMPYNLGDTFTNHIKDEFVKYMLQYEDDTNKTNKSQGEFRTGFLVMDTIKYAMISDMVYNDSFDFRMVVTCMDHLCKQYNNKIKVITDPILTDFTIDEFSDEVGMDIITSNSKEMLSI